MPDFVMLPESSSEVELLLVSNGFEIAKRHLDSARENITQGDWEAANSQCRTFLEALTDAIADNLFGADAAALPGGLAKRQLLANKGFLSREKHEFGDGNGQAFLPGLAKLLHPDGAHPGISNQPDAMFRLQAVVVTARWLLKRHELASQGSALDRAIGHRSPERADRPKDSRTPNAAPYRPHRAAKGPKRGCETALRTPDVLPIDAPPGNQAG